MVASTALLAMLYFRQHGWTVGQAAGIVASLELESDLDPHIRGRGDSHRAYGVAQWLPPRARVIEEHFGKALANMTLDEQLAAVQWEMTLGPEWAIGVRLRELRTAYAAGWFVSHAYERPQYALSTAKRRASLADDLETAYLNWQQEA